MILFIHCFSGLFKTKKGEKRRKPSITKRVSYTHQEVERNRWKNWRFHEWVESELADETAAVSVHTLPYTKQRALFSKCL